jgi:hypothetical protein
MIGEFGEGHGPKRLAVVGEWVRVQLVDDSATLALEAHPAVVAVLADDPREEVGDRPESVLNQVAPQEHP